MLGANLCVNLFSAMSYSNTAIAILYFFNFWFVKMWHVVKYPLKILKLKKEVTFSIKFSCCENKIILEWIDLFKLSKVWYLIICINHSQALRCISFQFKRLDVDRNNNNLNAPLWFVSHKFQFVSHIFQDCLLAW